MVFYYLCKFPLCLISIFYFLYVLQDCTIRSCDFDAEQTCVLHSPEKKMEQISSDSEVHLALTPLQPVVFFGFHRRMSVTGFSFFFMFLFLLTVPYQHVFRISYICSCTSEAISSPKTPNKKRLTMLYCPVVSLCLDYYFYFLNCLCV